MPNTPPIAPPSIGSGRIVGSSTIPCDKVDIKITEVEWLESYTRVCQQDKPIANWKVWKSSTSMTTTQVNSDDFFYQDCSDNPAVYFIRSSSMANHKKIKLKVRLKTVCGSALPISTSGNKAKLILSFGNKKFISNEFSLPAKDDEESVILEGNIDQISWLISPTFSLEYEDNDTAMTKNSLFSEKIPLEAFVLYDEPAKFYKKGVWVEVLRFLFKNTDINNDQDTVVSAGKIAKYCHSEHGMVYEAVNGKSSYFSFDFHIPYFMDESNKGEFELRGYLSKTKYGLFGSTKKKNIVNCYDQAAAVQSLCGALGIISKWIYMKPVGYIKTTNLVGIGSCNNPFYKSNNSNKVESRLFGKPGEGTIRMAFDNHVFVRLKETGIILDATIGPYIGDKSVLEYANEVLDIKVNFKFNQRIAKILGARTPPEESVYPKPLTELPLTLEAIEKSFKGKYKGHEHTRGYPLKGVSKIVW
ncbi:hypothetical protein [Gilliamella intestini]|uniref:Uncharacterized protein n=1 Tax=Gilliamella intestini TaxID=1798183 RepID=A0A1C4BKX4_9GAMM|nr:hypothetical protein [Gilliamella intestini]SCC07398.1 hypothetical protein GA0061080_10226 [Gilliamella intestini]